MIHRTEPVLDGFRIAELKLIAQRVPDGFLERIIETYSATAPSLAGSLVTALENGDAATSHSTAHRLKGSCLMVGAARLAAICRAIEREAARGWVDEGYKERLEAELEASIVALRDLAKSHSASDPAEPPARVN